MCQRRNHSNRRTRGESDRPKTIASTTTRETIADVRRAAFATRVDTVMSDRPYNPRVQVTGSGIPLVLVSGMDGTGQLFYRQVPLLASAFRVITYALRDQATRMKTLIDDLADVVCTAGSPGTPAVIVGESFGGALAMSFALAHPESVHAIVVLNTFPAFLPRVRLRLAIAGLEVMPWGAMGIMRHMTAFRMHSRHTHRSEI